MLPIFWKHAKNGPKHHSYRLDPDLTPTPLLGLVGFMISFSPYVLLKWKGVEPLKLQSEWMVFLWWYKKSELSKRPGWHNVNSCSISPRIPLILSSLWNQCISVALSCCVPLFFRVTKPVPFQLLPGMQRFHVVIMLDADHAIAETPWLFFFGVIYCFFFGSGPPPPARND